MNIDKYMSLLLSRRSQTAMLSAIIKTDRPIPDGVSQKEIEKNLKERIRILGDQLAADQRLQAFANALTLVMVDANFTILEMRAKGLFRVSRYKYKAGIIIDIAKAFIQIRHLINADPDRFTYLASVLSLARMAPNVRKVHDDICNFLKHRKNEAVKTLLVIVNQSFYSERYGDHELRTSDFNHYSSEELSEAASLILSMYRDMFRLTNNICDYVDEKSIKANDSAYDKLLVSAALINKFREAESLVDGLPYQAQIDGRTITVSSIDPDIEKSVRLGYIQTQNQLMIRAINLGKIEPPPSMKEIIEKNFNDHFGKMINVVYKPFKRIRFETLNTSKVFSLIYNKAPLRDEIESLLALDVDSFESCEDPIYNITDDISSKDIFKLQRYFRFVSCLYQKRLDDFTDNNEKNLMMFRSTVFVLPRTQLINQLNLVFLDYQKTIKIIDLLTLDKSRTFVDLQYTPLILFGDYYVVAPHIVAASNLVRNIICANKFRPRLIANKNDIMQNSVADALKKAGFIVSIEVESKIGGTELEIDIVAWKDNSLFIIECKNAYHPCSAHEMHNSFDHIDKASKQLDIRMGIFRYFENQRALFKKLSWNCAPTKSIYTAIVTANRVFHGAKLNGHPVRQAHEFINVLLHGQISGLKEKYRFWKGPDFQTTDLVSYLKGETIISDQMSALEPYTLRFNFGARSLNILTYLMNASKLEYNTRESYHADKD